MGDIETLIVNATVPEADDLTADEIMQICAMNKDPFSLITNAFLYGYMKGKASE
jgi:hypothetical protein